MVSGQMVSRENNTDTLYDFMQFMRNDEFFCEEARAGAPRSLMYHFLNTVEEVVEDLKDQFPELLEIEIPKFAKNDSDPNIKFEVWSYIQENTRDKYLVRSLDRY